MPLKSKDSAKNQKPDEKPQSFFSSVGSLIFIVILVFAFKSSILDANNIPSGSMIPTLKIGDFLFVNKMRYSLRMPFTEKEVYRFDDPKRGDIVTFIPPPKALDQEHPYTCHYSNVKKPRFQTMFSKRFVKRVMAMPGDTIRFSIKPMKGKDGNYVDYAFVEYKEKNKPNFENYSPQAVEPEKELSDLDNTKVEANRSALFLEKKRDFQHFVLEGNPGEGPYCFMRESCTRTPEGYICQIPEEYYMVMGDNRDDSSDSRFWGLVKREDILGKALIIYFSINWKDNTCNKFDSGFSDSPQGVSEEDKNKNCHPSEIGSRLDEESIFNWLDRTVRYRIWRMEVRWKRIGRILQ